MKTQANNNRYSVSIEHSEWGHILEAFTSKKEAIKRANEVKRNGSFWVEDLKFNEVLKCSVIVYDNKTDETVRNYNFTGKYLAYRKRISK